MPGDDSSVSRTADVARIRDALRGPGADTRVWASAAQVTDEPTIDTGAVYVPVRLVPSGIETTARLGAAYAGPDRGVWAPIHKDDEVLVVIPDGELASGPVIVARLANAIDTVPEEFTNEQVVVKAKAGEAILLATSSGGKVKLGDPNGGRAAVRHPELAQALTTYHTGQIIPHTHNVTAIGAPTGPAIVPGSGPDISNAASDSVEVD